MSEDYICDDRNIAVSKEIENMTDEEIEKEFKKRFGFLNVNKEGFVGKRTFENEANCNERNIHTEDLEIQLKTIDGIWQKN